MYSDKSWGLWKKKFLFKNNKLSFDIFGQTNQNFMYHLPGYFLSRLTFTKAFWLNEKFHVILWSSSMWYNSAGTCCCWQLSIYSFMWLVLHDTLCDHVDHCAMSE